MKLGKIVALIGAFVFMFSGFLPLYSVSLLGTTASANLMDVYSYNLAPSSPPSYEASPIEIYGTLLLMILYPVVVILGFVSVLKRKIAPAAGILGIICWIAGMLAVQSAKSSLGSTGSLVSLDIGFFAGLTGSIMLLMSHYLKYEIGSGAVSSVPPPPTL